MGGSLNGFPCPSIALGSGASFNLAIYSRGLWLLPYALLLGVALRLPRLNARLIFGGG